MKVLCVFFCYFAFIAKGINQVIPDTSVANKFLEQDNFEKSFDDAPVLINNNDGEKREINANETKYIEVVVKLISAETGEPINSGTVYSEPKAPVINSNLTDKNGYANLKLVPNIYLICGDANGYENACREIGPQTSAVTVFLTKNRRFKKQISDLLGLVTSDRHAEAVEYLVQLKTLYPGDNDLTYLEEKYELSK